MDLRGRAIILGAGGLLILAIILGSVMYLGRITKNTSSLNPSLSSLPVIQAVPSPTPGASNSLSQDFTRTYIGQAFVVNYPGNWGLLTCSNTPSFELDPVASSDIKGVICDTAVKPITILITDKLACQGNVVNIGPYKVTKSKLNIVNGDTNYRWCLKVNGKNLDITHRVSASGFQATSKEDFSLAVEEMIKNITVTPAGS